ncbi:hypothetical protein [Cystobacter ferrugineus]|nr:hypothetical protein [Cystobacter ferrugineus]
MAKQFITPANQIDFPNDERKQSALNQQWTTNLTGFTNQGIVGSPWATTESADNTYYFNPTTADTTGAIYAQIQWNAFPGRLSYYYGKNGGGKTNVSGLILSDDDLLSLADTGKTLEGIPFSQLPQIINPCSGARSSYGPFGPRGWQDEYCEWSVQRDGNNNIVRIDFTCENPEYMNSLWMIDPLKVLELYQRTLNKPQIQLQDLELREPTTGQPVIDPSTGRPAYNPLNKWNSGPVSTSTQGGAMHLTSTPNTLQTEIGLGALATAPRTSGNSDAEVLICCAKYGQPQRNSDPHIGQSVNQLVTSPNPNDPPMRATLANPPGLYIQLPDFAGSNYKTPDDTDPAACWTIVRGTRTLSVDGTQLPGNYILHATFQAPAGKSWTVSDITINGKRIQWGGQVAQTFLMQITGMAIPAQQAAPVRNCQGDRTPALPTPLQLFHANVFNALLHTPVPNVMGTEMNLASNSTLIAPIVKPGQSDIPMVLTASIPGTTLPTVSFGEGISVTVKDMRTVKYAVPGNTYPDEAQALELLVSVSANAALGLRGVWINQAQSPIAFPAALNVVAA